MSSSAGKFVFIVCKYARVATSYSCSYTLLNKLSLFDSLYSIYSSLYASFLSDVPLMVYCSGRVYFCAKMCRDSSILHDCCTLSQFSNFLF